MPVFVFTLGGLIMWRAYETGHTPAIAAALVIGCSFAALFFGKPR